LRRSEIVRKARRLIAAGRSQTEAAAELGVSGSSLSRYLALVRLGGFEALLPASSNSGRLVRVRLSAADGREIRRPLATAKSALFGELAYAAALETRRVGKIGRLPFALREEINRRLLNGDSYAVIVGWLNPLPQVRQRMADYFGKTEISTHNLCKWVKGGYQDFLRRNGHAAGATR
jgi:hypothetical protein